MIALRLLKSRWPLSLLALAILASCWALNFVLFAIVEAVLLEPLPFPRAEQLVVVEVVRTDFERESRSGLTPQQVDLVNDSSRTVQTAANYFGPVSRKLIAGDGGQTLSCSVAGADWRLFPLLATSLSQGRPFSADEETSAVLKADLFRKLFGEAALDQQMVRLENGSTYQVVGIASEEFEFPDSTTQMWVPLGPRDSSLPVIARLDDGSSAQEAELELAQVLEASLFDRSLQVLSVKENKVAQFRPILFALWLTALGLLLIALFNYANLHLVRFESQKPAWILRGIVGAGPSRLFGALLQQNLVFSALSLLAGLWMAYAALPLVRSALPVHLPRIENAGIMASSLIPGLILALLVAVLLAALMYLLVSRAPVMEILRTGQDQVGSGASLRRWRTPLLIAQVALAVVLVYCSALLAVSFNRIVSVAPGFRQDVQALELAVSPRLFRNVSEQKLKLEEIVSRVRELPGIISAGVGSSIPSGRPSGEMSISPVNSSLEDKELLSNARYTIVDRGYLETLGFTLLRGRFFRQQEGSPVVLANRRLVEDAFPQGEGLGQVILKAKGVRIVGVVNNIKQTDLRNPTYGELYLYWGDAPPPSDVLLNRVGMPFPVLVWRSENGLAKTLADVKAVVRSSLPEARIVSSEGPFERLQARLGQPRFFNRVIGILALLGLSLAIAGVYGVSASIVSRRLSEFGLRSALGAQPRELVLLIIRDISLKAALGLVIGIPLALAAAQAFGTILFRLSPSDPFILTSIVGFLGLAVVAGTLIPALRAYRLDPGQVLRES